MVTKEILEGKHVFLRQIELSDCSERYVEWLNDPEVNQYLETKWYDQNIASIREFVRYQRKNSHSVLFSIMTGKSVGGGTRCVHIGNIKIGPVHPHYQHADISYFIGEKDMWGKGIATEAIQLVCKFGFEKMNLHKIEAGTYADAVGSQRALEKNGFLREGTFRDRVFFDGIWMDVYRYGLLRDELKSSTNRGGVRTEHIIRNRDKPAALWSRKAAA